jgi:hypothetical protein
MRVVEEITVRTPPATLQKIYNLPEFGSTLEFLTMLALSGGRLLKVKEGDTKLVPKFFSNLFIYLNSTRVELPI